MVEQIDNPPDKNPLPIVLFFAMFPIYFLGASIGLNIELPGLVGAIFEPEGTPFLFALIVGAIPLLVSLFLSLSAIRKIASGTRRTAAVLVYLICCVMSLSAGVFVVPTLLLAFLR